MPSPCFFVIHFSVVLARLLWFLSNATPPNGLYCILSLDSLHCAVKQAYGVNLDTEPEGSLVCVTSWSVYRLEIKISVLLLIYVILRSYSLTVLTRGDILCALNFIVCTKKGKRNHKIKKLN